MTSQIEINVPEDADKKEWEDPKLTVLGTDATQGGSGQIGLDNNYS